MRFTGGPSKTLCCMPPNPLLLDRIAQSRELSAAAPAGLDLTPFDDVVREPSAPGYNDGVVAPVPSLTPGLAAVAAPTRPGLRGTLQVLVVLVDFPGTRWSAAPKRFHDLFFSAAMIPTGSVNDFYEDASGGTVNIAGQVAGPFTLPNPLSHYANGGSGLGRAPNAQDMALDAFNACRHSVNFAHFDNDSDGFVDAFVVVHAGQGAETTGSKNDIWSHKWTFRGGSQPANGKQVFGYLTIPEDARLGVCAHELGHLLFGWPDLYDTTGASSGFGNFCLMAGGAWGGGGNSPVHPSAWCKAQQGWVQVSNQVGAGSVTLDDVKRSHQVTRLWSSGAIGPEYFLVENRQITGFDHSLPGGGLLIYHVDEVQPGNTNPRRYKVGLVQADGKGELETGINRGDAADPYPGTGGNTVLDAASSPTSNGYGGSTTGVAMQNISIVSGIATFDASV